MHFTLSGVGLSILIGLLYRYYSLKQQLSIFHSKRIILIIGSTVIAYPVPSLIPNWIQYRYSEKDSQDFIQHHYPDLFDVYIHWTCSSYYDEISLMLSIILALIQIFAVGICSAYYAVKCVQRLNSVKNSLTITTYALQKRLLVILCFQLMIPVCCLVIPTTVLFIAVLVGSKYIVGEFSI